MPVSDIVNCKLDLDKAFSSLIQILDKKRERETEKGERKEGKG